MIQTTPAPDRYTRFSCPNPRCVWFNQPGEGNITHRSWTGTHKHIERLRCTACDQEAFPKNRRNKWRYPVHFTGQGVHVRYSEVQSA